MEIITHKNKTNIDSQGDSFLLDAIQSYISKTNFPKKIEVKRIKATAAYYNEKRKQHDSLILKSKEEIIAINNKMDELKSKCNNLLHDLKQSIG